MKTGIMTGETTTRRAFLGGAAALAACAIVPGRVLEGGSPLMAADAPGRPNSVFNGVRIGTITYSYRSMAKTAEETLAALLKDASQKAFDCVVVSRLTRFGRSARDLVNNLGALDDHNIRFVSLKENIDTSTPAGRLLRHVLIGIAEFEHETIKDQMLSNRHVRARRGDILIGKPPYGYTWDKGRKCIEINPEEEAVYRRMVGMCLGGKSYRDVAIALRRDGIKAKLALFSSTVVGQILKNPCYYSGRLLRNTNVFKGNQRTK